MNIRLAEQKDLSGILDIYNMGIIDRIATLESEAKSIADMQTWWDAHNSRYAILVAEKHGHVVGWASLNPYSHRCAYSGVADLSIYVSRIHRGTGIGAVLLHQLDIEARRQNFHKIVLFTFPQNIAGQRLYLKAGYKQVGIFEKQGVLDGNYMDVMAMEKIL
ncbi:MAG: pat [Paenibacillaceae bacterium]|jgi:phosphinothricin acetyltransferase|nr:pat [Paenibacillaceae bacterium]